MAIGEPVPDKYAADKRAAQAVVQLAKHYMTGPEGMVDDLLAVGIATAILFGSLAVVSGLGLGAAGSVDWAAHAAISFSIALSMAGLAALFYVIRLLLQFIAIQRAILAALRSQSGQSLPPNQQSSLDLQGNRSGS